MEKKSAKAPISLGYPSSDNFTAPFVLSKPISEVKMETGNTGQVMRGKSRSLCIRLDIICPQFKSVSCHQFPSATLGHSFNVSAPQLLTCKMRMLIQLSSIPQSTLATLASGTSALRLFLINYFPKCSSILTSQSLLKSPLKQRSNNDNCNSCGNRKRKIEIINRNIEIIEIEIEI